MIHVNCEKQRLTLKEKNVEKGTSALQGEKKKTAGEGRLLPEGGLVPPHKESGRGRGDMGPRERGWEGKGLKTATPDAV